MDVMGFIVEAKNWDFTMLSFKLAFFNVSRIMAHSKFQICFILVGDVNKYSGHLT